MFRYNLLIYISLCEDRMQKTVIDGYTEEEHLQLCSNLWSQIDGSYM